MGNHLITFMVFIPLLGAVVQAFCQIPVSRWVALASSIAAFLCALALVLTMQGQIPDLQHVESFSWIGSYAVSYEMGLDGLNVLLVLLIALVFPLLIGSEWTQFSGVRGMHGLLLVLETALLGAACAQDLFLLFFFWALSALPFYFLIGIWGGKDRESAAFRAMAVSAIGNALFFAAMVLIYYSLDPHTFSLRELAGGKLEGKTFQFLGQELSVSTVSFVLISIGLALRAPIWPLHGWFTKVSDEAPATVSVALSALTVPVATYIFVRLSYSLFPDTVAHSANVIVAVGAINLIVGGICAAAQRGLRLLMAYICVAETGLLLMGVGSLTSAGVVGAIYQQLALGLGIAGFGLFSGIIFDRTGQTRFLNDQAAPEMGGIASYAPTMAIVTGIVIASLLGIPGLGGFVGHALLLIGTYPSYPAVVLVAAIALLLATYYLLSMYRYVFLGQPGELTRTVSDLSIREKAYLLPLVVCLLAFGLYPKPLVELVRPSVLTLLSTIK